MEKQKTAVDFLYEFVLLKLSNEQQMQFEGLFHQAKQMEKEQIGLAFIVGYAHGSVDSGLTAKEYYSERYEDKAENNS